VTEKLWRSNWEKSANNATWRELANASKGTPNCWLYV